MAKRLNTIEYSFESITGSVTQKTPAIFKRQQIYIPEVNTRNVRHAVFEVFFRQADATIANLSAMTWIIQCGSSAAVTMRELITVANSGEHMTHRFFRDFSNYFNSAIGTSGEINCTLSATWEGGPAAAISNNFSCKLKLTYDYDDTSLTTGIKTVRVPIESISSFIVATNTSLGTQVPALDTFLPEVNKVYRDIFFETSGNELGATNNFNLRFSLDAETPLYDGIHNCALNSGNWYKYIWKRLGSTASVDMVTSATHEYIVGITGNGAAVTNRFLYAPTILYVTYEYSTTQSASSMISAVYPWGWPDGPVGGPVSALATRAVFNFLIPEKDPELKQSGVHYFFNCGVAVTGLQLRTGHETKWKQYNHAIGTLAIGQYNLIRRFDSGATATEAAVNLINPIHHGYNSLTADWFRTSVAAGSIPTNMAAIVYVNYVAPTAASGHACMTKTIYTPIQQASSSIVIPITSLSGSCISIPESRYFIHDTGFASYNNLTPNASVNTSNACTLQAQILPNELDINAGWANISRNVFTSGVEYGLHDFYVDDDDLFSEHPLELHGFLSPNAPRCYMFMGNGLAPHISFNEMFTTYSSIYHSISGQLTGYSGSPTSAVIFIADFMKREQLFTTTANDSGIFSEVWYLTANPVSAIAMQSPTGAGSSMTGYPTEIR